MNPQAKQVFADSVGASSPHGHALQQSTDAAFAQTTAVGVILLFVLPLVGIPLLVLLYRLARFAYKRLAPASWHRTK